MKDKIPKHILKSLNEEPRQTFVNHNKNKRLNQSTNNIEISMMSDLKQSASIGGVYQKRSDLNSAITDVTREKKLNIRANNIYL